MFEGCIGIDLGTTYSCVSIWLDNNIHVIPNDIGQRTTPSYVLFDDDEILVGDIAKQSIISNISKTAYDVKRIIGKRYSELKNMNELEKYTYKIIDDGNDNPMLFLNDKKYYPEEIGAHILKYLKRCCETYIDKEVKKVVITVPAYFNDMQRNSTKYSCEMAGLECVRIVNEPTAACLSYGIHNKNKAHILIFDLGGGTLDVSVLNMYNGIFDILSTNGDTHLGGIDFDNIIHDYICETYNNIYGEKIAIDDIIAHKNIRDLAENIKKILSQRKIYCQETLNIYNAKSLKINITRDKFNELCKNLYERCIQCVEKALLDANILKTDINEVILIGGSTRIPYIQTMLKELFNMTKLNSTVNPDEAVALGAGILGSMLTNNHNSEILDDMMLLDIIPLSLGVETDGGIMTPVILRNSKIPTSKTLTFSTTTDNQTTVNIKIFEGERPLTKDNNFLGFFKLTGISKSLRGIPKIEVKFDVDYNGILEVSAVETIDCIKNNIIIKKEKNISPADLINTINSADNNKEADENTLKKTKIKLTLYNDIKEYTSHINRYNKVHKNTIEIDKEYICSILNQIENINSYTELQELHDNFTEYTKTVLNDIYNNQTKIEDEDITLDMLNDMMTNIEIN